MQVQVNRETKPYLDLVESIIKANFDDLVIAYLEGNEGDIKYLESLFRDKNGWLAYYDIDCEYLIKQAKEKANYK